MKLEGLIENEKNPFSLYEERLEEIKDSLELEDLKTRLEIESRLYVLKEEYYERRLNNSGNKEDTINIKRKISKLKQSYKNNICKIRYLIAARIVYMSDIELDKYRKNNRYIWKIEKFLGETIEESEKNYNRFFNVPISEMSSICRCELLAENGIKDLNSTDLTPEVLDYFLYDIKKYISNGEEELIRKIGGSNIHQTIIENIGLIDQIQIEINSYGNDNISFIKRKEFIRRLEGVLGREDAPAIVDLLIRNRNNIPFFERFTFLSEQVRVLDEIYFETDKVKQFCKEKEKKLIEENLDFVSDDYLTSNDELTEEKVSTHEKK